MGWIFRGCALAVLTLGVLLVLMILGALGVIEVPMKGVSVTFCIIAGVLFIIPLIVLMMIGMWFRKLAKEIDKEDFDSPMSGFSDIHSAPAEITLVPVTAGKWKKSSKVTQAETQLASLGFVDAGEFNVNELPNVKMHAMFKPTENLWALVTDMEDVAAWTDMVIYYEDGTSKTWTNAPKSGFLDQPPGHEKFNDKEADAVKLYGMFKESESIKPARPAKPSDFKTVYEKAYREEMKWRMSRGGTTREEIKRLALSTGQEASPEVLEMLEESTRQENCSRLIDVFRKGFVDSNQITAAKWESVRDHVIFIHEQLKISEAMEFFEDEEGESPKAPEGIQSVRAAFAAVNETMPTARKYEYLGKLEDPTLCEIYAPAR